jgi:outer membrane protein W
MPTQQAQTVQEGAFTLRTKQQALLGDFNVISASGALPPNVPGRSLITKAGVAALTLAAPVLADDGMTVEYISTTAQAHTITATGLFVDGAAHVNLATFAAQIGASIRLMALGGKWYVRAVQGVTMS